MVANQTPLEPMSVFDGCLEMKTPDFTLIGVDVCDLELSSAWENFKPLGDEQFILVINILRSHEADGVIVTSGGTTTNNAAVDSFVLRSESWAVRDACSSVCTLRNSCTF